MSKFIAYEFTVYGLTNSWYGDETVFEVTDHEGRTVPMRSPEFNARHGVSNVTPAPNGADLG